MNQSGHTPMPPESAGLSSTTKSLLFWLVILVILAAIWMSTRSARVLGADRAATQSSQARNLLTDPAASFGDGGHFQQLA
jgi:hypothetical protein